MGCAAADDFDSDGFTGTADDQLSTDLVAAIKRSLKFGFASEANRAIDSTAPQPKRPANP